MSDQKRFHIWFGDSRTTITVDTVLFELMAIKLKHQPDDENAHYGVNTGNGEYRTLTYSIQGTKAVPIEPLRYS